MCHILPRHLFFINPNDFCLGNGSSECETNKSDPNFIARQAVSLDLT